MIQMHVSETLGNLIQISRKCVNLRNQKSGTHYFLRMVTTRSARWAARNFSILTHSSRTFLRRRSSPVSLVSKTTSVHYHVLPVVERQFFCFDCTDTVARKSGGN